ncbi:MAG: two-component system cell cycle sensor histidine kinase/response regulator CckA [Planctomycetota bacterium]
MGGHDGSPPLFVGIKRAATDVELRRTEAGERERHELLESLKQAQKMEVIGQLAAGVAHDFNNLLTPIMGYADLELHHQVKDSAGALAMEGILESARRGRDLTSQLLAFARKQVMSMEVLDLGQQIEAGQGMLQQLIPGNGSFILRFDLAPGVSPVRADPGQLHQVLMNLVVNARDSMADGSEILVQLRNIEVPHGDPLVRVLGAAGTYVMLCVSDQGCGMDAATQERIFEPFFSTKTEHSGTGLGLSIAHGIVGQHAGHIHSVSEVGRGTTFQIYLPPASADDIEASSPKSSRGADASSQKTILLVEDEGPVRAVVIRILSELGYRVLSANDGQAALDLAAQITRPTHLLLTDVMMPNMNGPQLCAKMRERDPNLPVLYTSGFARDELAGDGILGDGISMIEKPFTSAELVKKIQVVLPNQRAARS